MPIAHKNFIAIEGTDGSGKATQTELLVKKLTSQGQGVSMLDFPQYGEPSAYFVEQYLNGSYGDFANISPRAASVFYALDRFDTKNRTAEALMRGDIIISNRYVASNLAHQGSKILDPAERADFFKWVYDLEYNELGIPRPGLNILLLVPASISYQLIERKTERDYLKKGKRDAHEADLEHLRTAEAVYRELAGIFPEDFAIIECAEGDEILPIDKIHEQVYAKVSNWLGSTARPV